MIWSWRDEASPPLPRGMVASGAVARRLYEIVRARDQDHRVGMSLTANADLLVLIGHAGSLPWVDGATYIAPRDEAPALWLPTTQCPTVPLDLLSAALHRRHGAQPLLLLKSPAVAVPLSRAWSVDPGLLVQLAARWGIAA